MTLLHERSDALTLGVVRAAVFGIWIAVVVPDRLSFLGTLPRSMFEPIGLLRVVPDGVWDAALEPGALRAFEAALVVALVLAAAGVRPYRPIALAAALGLTLHQGLLRSFTFDNHEELALLLCAYVLVLFPAADGFSIPRRRGPGAAPAVYAAAMVAMTGLLLLPYTEIAAHRLAHAAPAVFTGDSLPYWFASLDWLDRDGWGVGLSLLGHPALIAAFKAGFVVTTVFELLAPLSLIMPRFRRAWIVVVVSFHLVNWFTLNLFFWQNALLVLLLVTDTEAVVARARALLRPAVRRHRITTPDPRTLG